MHVGACARERSVVPSTNRGAMRVVTGKCDQVIPLHPYGTDIQCNDLPPMCICRMYYHVCLTSSRDTSFLQHSRQSSHLRSSAEDLISFRKCVLSSILDTVYLRAYPYAASRAANILAWYQDCNEHG